MHSPFTKIRYILTFASSSLEQFLRATWGAVSLAIVLTLPQIRLNSQPSQCVFFFFKLTVSCLWSWMRWLPKLLSISSSQAPLTTLHFARLEPCLPLPAKSWQPVSLVLLNPSSRAWHTVRSSKPKGQSLERKMVYYWTKQGERVASVQRNPRWFSGKSF